MFYNYSLNIVKKVIYIVLGLLLILKILGADVDVFAVDYGYDHYTNSGSYGRYDCVALDCSITKGSTSFVEGSELVELGFENPRDYVYRLRLRVYGNSSYIFEQGNTYTFRFTVNLKMVQDGHTNLTNDDVLEMLQNNYRIKSVYGNTSATSTDSSTDYIDNFSYYWKEGSVEGRYVLYFTFTTTADLKFVSIFWSDTSYLAGNEPNYTHNFFGSYNVSYLKVTYSEGINSAIDNQTIVMQNEFEDVKEKIDDMMNIFKSSSEATNDTIKDTDISGGQEGANNFFSNFEDNDYGLSSVIKAPLTFVNKLSSGVCTPLTLPLPFVDTDVTLPCMTEVYQKHFPTFLDIYQLITTGIIAYGVCLNIFKKTKDFKNPDNDKIEVMDL